MKIRRDGACAEEAKSLGLDPVRWYRVVRVDGGNAILHHAPIPSNRDQEDTTDLRVPLHLIVPPIGWLPQYTIEVRDLETAQKIVSNWFQRGIVVRQSHDLSYPGLVIYQPLDNSEQPHWRYPEISDKVVAEDCASVFRVVVVEEEVSALRDLSPKDRRQTLAKMRDEGWDVEFVRSGGGIWVRTRQEVFHDWAGKTPS